MVLNDKVRMFILELMMMGGKVRFLKMKDLECSSSEIPVRNYFFHIHSVFTMNVMNSYMKSIVYACLWFWELILTPNAYWKSQEIHCLLSFMLVSLWIYTEKKLHKGEGCKITFEYPFFSSSLYRFLSKLNIHRTTLKFSVRGLSLQFQPWQWNVLPKTPLLHNLETWV